VNKRDNTQGLISTGVIASGRLIHELGLPTMP